jgi:HEAT repeat protein
MCVKSVILLCCLFMCGCGSVDRNYIDQLRSGTPEQRAQAASFLGAQRIAEAIPHLQVALQDESIQVRVKVIWALGSLRSKRVLDNLLPLMQDTDRNIRQATARALMQIEEPKAIVALERALKIEYDTWVVKDITMALEHLRQFEGEVDVRETSVRGEFF